MNKEELLNTYLSKHVLKKLNLNELKSFCSLILNNNPYNILDDDICKNIDVKFEVFKDGTLAETDYNELSDRVEVLINSKELLKFAEVDSGNNIVMLISTLAHEYRHVIQEYLIHDLDNITIIDKYLIKLITSHNALYFINDDAITSYCHEVFCDKPKNVRDYLTTSVLYGIYSNHFHEQDAEMFAQQYVTKLLEKIDEHTNDTVVKDFVLDNKNKNYQILPHESSRKNFELLKKNLLSQSSTKIIKKHNSIVSLLKKQSDDSKKTADANLKKIASLNSRIRSYLSLCDDDQKLLIIENSLIAEERHFFDTVSAFLESELYLQKNNEHLLVRAALNLLRKDLSGNIKHRICERIKDNFNSEILIEIFTALNSCRTKEKQA